MDMTTGRPDHIEDVLIHLHTGQWFGWSDPKDKVYANLIALESHPIPAESVLEGLLADAQAEWDNENAPYKLARKAAYPSWEEQMDMKYHDAVNGTSTWEDAIAAVKAAHPKPS